jgi:hypothetical protein
MVRAFKLYTGADKASHVLEGTIDEKDRTPLSLSISRRRRRTPRTIGTRTRNRNS